MPTIFLSHSAADVTLARLLEDTLREADSSIDVFRTSRTGQIPSGLAWFDHIWSHLRSADRYVILLTPISQSRPWVIFEAGAAKFSGRPTVPVLGGGLTIDQLIEPLRNLQALSLEKPDEAGQAFQDLGIPLSDPAGFADQARLRGAEGRIAALEAEGWECVELDGIRYAWDGPIERLTESFGVPAPDSLIAALKAARMQPQYGIPKDLSNEYANGFRQVWRIDPKLGRRHALLASFGQVLVTRPEKAR